MKDIYLYEDCGVLKNLLNIKDKSFVSVLFALIWLRFPVFFCIIFSKSRVKWAKKQ